AVVLGRVVAGGDHHAGRGAEVPHGEGGQRGGSEVGKDEGGDAVAPEDGGHVLARLQGEVPRVVSHHHAAPSGVGDLRLEVGGESGGGAHHHHSVHPIGPRAQDP